jgi:hypothetical protein
MMRNLILAGSLLFLGSCTTDFVLTEEWRDVPVVYGFINRTDTAHYIRVEKLFVDENRSAVEIAQIADSLYYPNAKVSLFNITKNRSHGLIRVDANLEGYQRKPGPFATAPNFMYKIKASDIPLSAGDSLVFQLDRGDQKPLVTARIALIRDFAFTSPADQTREIKFDPALNQNFSWRGSGLSASTIYDFEILVQVQEENTVTGAIQTKTVRWALQQGDIKTSVAVQGLSFFSLLKNNLTVDPAISRKILSLDFQARAGGPEITDFNAIINANTGITASQEIPRFTNLSEGFGLVSSVHTIRRSLGITAETRNLLRTVEETRLLNF